jgi:hypothetical protein
MKRMTTAIVMAIATLLLGSISAAAQGSYASNAQRALQWLECSQQQANGQIGSGGNPIARSSEVALGLAAAGQPAAAMKHGLASLADYLKTAVSADVGTNGELLLARASQSDAGPTGTVVAALEAGRSQSGPTKGEYGGDIYSDALAILGLHAAGESIPQDSIDFLVGQQKSDGGWSADNADQYGTDSNTTSLVLQALIASGLPASNTVVSKGFDYLQTVFSAGGFGDGPQIPPDPNSDELGVQAILAGGLQRDAQWASRLDQALSYLAGQQISGGADQGAITSQYSKLFATTFAPAVFLDRPLTIAGRAETTVALLPCATTVAASSSPTAMPAGTPTTTTTTRLAQTGAGPAGGTPWQSALAVLLIIGGLGWLWLRGVRRFEP